MKKMRRHEIAYEDSWITGSIFSVADFEEELLNNELVCLKGVVRFGQTALKIMSNFVVELSSAAGQ